MPILFPVLKDAEDTTEVRKALLSIENELSSGGSSSGGREVRIILSNVSGVTISAAPGQVWADDNSTMISLTSTIQGTISSPVNSTWYGVYIFGGASPPVLGFSTTDNPSLPSGYTLKRRIGWVYVNSGGAILGFTQYQNEFYYTAFQYDRVNAVLPVVRTAVPVTVPQTSNVVGFFTCRFSDATAADFFAWLKGAYFTDVAPNFGISNLGAGLTARGNTTIKELITDGNAYIRGNSASMFLSISTEGFLDLDI